MAYIANHKKLEHLPALFPIVVCNGSDKWTAPDDLAIRIESGIDLGNYGVRCRYFKIAENSFSQAQLLAIRNLVSTLFLAEAHYDLDLLIEEFVHLFEQESDKQAVALPRQLVSPVDGAWAHPARRLHSISTGGTCNVD